jgi:mono/diheme cytochrome c family protein
MKKNLVFSAWQNRAMLARIPWIILLLAPLFGGCDYMRMKDQASVRTYEEEMPARVEGSIPVGGGIEILKAADPDRLRNPLPSTKQTIEQGRTAYGYFCMMCHGPAGDGNGTVGQSFAPLPTDLRGSYVQGQNDGLMFYRISLGYKHHPPLADTVSEDDRWAVIHYIRAFSRGRKTG